MQATTESDAETMSTEEIVRSHLELRSALEHSRLRMCVFLCVS
jgi:hypothetical protein